MQSNLFTESEITTVSPAIAKPFVSSRAVMPKTKLPPKPNKTKKATGNDIVYTKDITAKWIVDYFNPQGSVLDAAAGKDAFFSKFRNKEKFRCEIEEGSDFFEWHKKVDWIITNPPYSIYDNFLEHCFEIADNIVLLVPISKAFKSVKTQEIVLRYGGLREIVYMGGGRANGFPFGFSVGCLYYKKGYKGDCKITYEFKRK